MNSFSIGSQYIGYNSPSYFIADIAANHNGSLDKAIELIKLAADAGANAAKFQNFSAKTIVSDIGFKKLGRNFSHQASWKASVYDVYDKASISLEWTHHLSEACKSVGIDYMTAPYDLAFIQPIDPYVSCWKVGSGDITWLDNIKALCATDKPILLATGASSMNDVVNAYNVVSQYGNDCVLMQCNTNYTGSLDNFKYINLNVLRSYSLAFPQAVLGLSDHTPGHATVLGAIALGARVIEKHFTDDVSQEGPDHAFSMDPDSWRSMVVASRQLELSLGDGIKVVEENEQRTVQLQRRALRAAKDIEPGQVLTTEDVVCLRPCPGDGLEPSYLTSVLGSKTNHFIAEGDLIPRELLK